MQFKDKTEKLDQGCSDEIPEKFNDVEAAERDTVSYFLNEEFQHVDETVHFTTEQLLHVFYEEFFL